MLPHASARSRAALALVVLVGTLARVPGLFWGYHVFDTDNLVLHPDELPYTFGRGPDTAFPRGLSVQVRLLEWVLQVAGLRLLAHSLDWDFFAGRVVTLVYGVLTLLVVYRLARALFRDETVGVLAALFLALADLHVTYSHLGIPDSPATFWFYAVLATAHTALARDSRRSALLSAACSGAAAAMRFQAMSLVPLAWWVARSRRRVRNGLLLAAAAGVVFFAFNGFGFNPLGTARLLGNIARWGDLGWKKLFLPAVYAAVLLVGVGLPVFLLAAYGLVRLAREKWASLRSWRDLLADDQVPVCLAPLAAFVQVSTVGLWAHRHAVVLVPFVAILAAYGAARLPRRAVGPLSARAAAGSLLALVVLYQAVHVASVQTYFVDDPLEKAGRWLRAHVPPGELLAHDPAAKVPSEYPTTDEWSTNFLVLTARSYRRYFFRDFLPTHVTGRPVTREDIAAKRVFGGEADELEQFQQLFAGRLPYRLVKRFRLRFYTPELALAEAYWYPPPHLNEVRIYARRRERVRRLDLLTPGLHGYLVTLDTGRLWQPAPGQAIRVLLNGEALPVALRPGLNHLVLPDRLVSAPASRLEIVSDQLLPFLPSAPVGRVRPLREAFAVEPLLDGDLMPEGFSTPEVRPDGAVVRWVSGTGTVLLPGRGDAGEWLRLAVRLRGRPSGTGPPQPVVFVLDGRKVGEALAGDADRVVEYALPPGAPAAPLATLHVLTPPWGPPRGPGPENQREAAVALSWLAVTRRAEIERGQAPAPSVPAWRPLFGLLPRHRVERVRIPSDRLTLAADLFTPTEPARGAIVLAHGASVLGRRHALYVGLAHRLAEHGYVVLSPDFRGYGESDHPPRIAVPADLDFTSDLVAAVGFLAGRAGGRAVTVVGHSFGAGVALAAAARDARVAKVVAISPGRRVHERVLGSAEGQQTIRDRMAFEMHLAPERLPLEIMDAVIRPIVIDTYVDHPFRQPVLLVDGGREELADLRFLRALVPRMRARTSYVTVPNADHYFGVERQREERDPVTLDLLADVVDGFIRDGDRWAASR